MRTTLSWLALLPFLWGPKSYAQGEPPLAPGAQLLGPQQPAQQFHAQDGGARGDTLESIVIPQEQILRQFAAMAAHLITQLREFLLLGQQRLACRQPLRQRRHFRIFLRARNWSCRCRFSFSFRSCNEDLPGYFLTENLSPPAPSILPTT